LVSTLSSRIARVPFLEILLCSVTDFSVLPVLYWWLLLRSGGIASCWDWGSVFGPAHRHHPCLY
jgi:hypothetical protein